MFYTQIFCLIKYFAGFLPKYEWYVWISGLLVPSVCAILLVSGSSVFAVVKPFDQQTTLFLSWLGISWNRLSSADRIRIVDGATDCYVRSPSWNFSLGWRSRLVAQAAQDFTQSKMMHPAVGKAKTETGRGVV